MAQTTLPTGGTVVKGAATIEQSGASQVITQTSQKAIINWQDFSVGADGSVNFVQPNASAIVLNRVIGSSRSNIYGKLTANGQVFIVNPNGVYFGAGSSVDVGGLLATTLDIGDDDFMNGNYLFTRGESAAVQQVINEGLLKARDSGYIVLAGDYAANRGIVQARLGTVALASGSQMTMDLQGDSLINFAVDAKTVAQLSGVENSGQLLADGGRAIMTAAVATDLQTAVVNNTGVVQAQTAEDHNGEIILSADGGNTQNSGTLDASGKAAGQTGGTIQVLGDKVALTDNAVVDASGDVGGGNINIGGNYQGKGPLANAQTNYVGQDVQIKADAITKGNGGSVVVWSDDWTRYYGGISAQGGAQGGNGGSVEVSGKQLLDFDGTVNTLAAKGSAGTLLLDPADMEIVNGDVVGGNDQTVDTSPSSAPGSAGDTVFSDATDNGGTSQMAVGVLEDALEQGNVTVQTSTSSGSAPKGGTITIDDGSGNGVQWDKATQLKLQADNQILIKSDVQGSNSGSSIWLDAVNGATQSSGTNIKAGSLLLTDGTNGTGTWTLVGSGNNVNTFAADLSTTGTLDFQNNQGMTVGSVTGWDTGTTVSGIQHANGDTQLNILSGSLSLAKDVDFGTLYINTSNGLTQQSGEKITGDSLFVTGGAVTLTNSGNNINTLSADINGALAYTDADTLTVGAGRNGFNGIATNNHNVTLTTGDSTSYDPSNQPDATNPASLVLNESVNAGSGTVRLTAGTGGVYQRHDANVSDGAITAGGLLLKGSSSSKVTPFVLTNASNRVDTLAGTANGSISFAGAGNSSSTLTVGSIDGVNGLTTTANTIVSTTHNSDGSTTNSYNENNISLSVGGNLTISKNITASTANGTDTISLGIGGDFVATTNSGVKVTADTLGVFGDDNEGTFYITSDVSNLAAGGGKLMVIDNSQHVGSLTGLGIGAVAADQSSVGAASSASGDDLSDLSGSSKPVGDFYLTTSGALNIIKLLSQGKNLMLRSSSLSILLDASTADDARIMLQPYNLSSSIGINNATESGFNAGINYDAATLLKFTNPVSTFYFGTPQDAILTDISVPNAARNYFTGDIHIGYDGAFNLGYRSLSAETSGNLVAYNVGPLYNLRLDAPSMTIYSFNTFGDQIHLFTNDLSLPNSVSSYVNPNDPTITWRSLDDQTIWVGYSYVNNEKQFLPSTLVKLPDGSTIVVGGSTDYPFPNGGAGYGDIHITWDDGLVSLGNRKLVLSTQHRIYDYNATPAHTEDHSGTAGGLWQGCQNLNTCAGTNADPYPDPTPGSGSSSGSGSDSGSSTTTDGGSGGCQNCPPAPPNTNPYPPDTSTGDNGNGAGSGSGGDGTGADGGGGGDGGAGMGDGGAGDGSNGAGLGGGGDGSGNNGAGIGGNGAGNTGDGSGDGGAGIGDGGSGDGSNGAGLGGGGDGTGNNGAGNGGSGAGNTGDGSGDGGAGMGDGGAGDGSNGAGLGGGGDGTGNNGAGNGGNGAGNTGDGSGDGGAGMGDGGSGDGSNGAGLGGGGDGSGNNGAGNGGNGDGAGDGGAGMGSGGSGDGNNGAGLGGDGNGGNGNGTGNTGDGSGDGGAGTGSGGTGDGNNGNGNGDNGAGNGGTGNGSADNGNGNPGDGNAGSGTGGAGDGNGDSGAGTGDGGTGDGASNAGNGDGGMDNANNGNGNGGSGGDHNGDAGAGTGSGGAGDGSGNNGQGAGNTGNGAGDNGAGTGGANQGDTGNGSGNGGNGSGDGSGSDNGNGSQQSGGETSPAFDISCQDVQESREEKPQPTDQKGAKDLVEVKRDGLRMNDPCQHQPMQKDHQ